MAAKDVQVPGGVIRALSETYALLYARRSSCDVADLTSSSSRPDGFYRCSCVDPRVLERLAVKQSPSQQACASEFRLLEPGKHKAIVSAVGRHRARGPSNRSTASPAGPGHWACSAWLNG
eukprot:752300-Hanusia_phi.AAC.4